jgi:hypothetical protein
MIFIILLISLPILCEELLVQDWEHTITTGDCGFPSLRDLDGHMPGANGNWIQPIDYAHGDMHNRLEIRSMPVSQSFSWQTCFHQNGTSLEECGGIVSGFTGPTAGNPPLIKSWSFNIDGMAAFGDGPIDWSKPRSMSFGVIRGSGGYISCYDWLNPSTGAWAGHDPSTWYPMVIRWTIVVVSPGATFSGWDNYIAGVRLTNGTCTPSSIPDSLSTQVAFTVNVESIGGSTINQPPIRSRPALAEGLMLCRSVPRIPRETREQLIYP